MTRLTRRVLIVAGSVTGLIVLAAAALPFLVDVNRYRPLIVSSVKEATGRTIELGTISFALLPAPGLRVSGPIRLSDSAAYPGRSALTAESLSVRLGLWPLLRGRASVTSFVLHRPTLTLIRDVRGRWNFDDLVERAEAARTPGAPGSSETGRAGVVVHRARVTAGRVLVYDDAVQPGRRAEAVIAPIDATINGWGGEGPTELDLSAGLGKSVLEARASLSAGKEPRLTLRAKSRRLRAEDFATLLPWIGVARPAGLQVSGSVDLDGSAELPIEHPEALRFKGSLALDGLSYRDAGMALPLKDLSGRLMVDGDRAEWKDFNVRAGASSLQGSLQVEDFVHPRVGFKLTSPRIDLNEIVATLVPAAPAGAAPTSAAAAGSGSAGILEQISGAGRLDVKQVRFQTFDLSNVGASMTLAKCFFSLKDLRASLYGGTLSGSAGVDLSRAVPRYALAARLKGVDVDPLVTDYDKELSGLLRGRLAGTLDLGASGAGMDAILKTASGSGAVELTDGSLTSFSVLKQLAALLELAGGKGIGKESTPFESLTSDLTIADGQARTDDLALRSTDLDLDAKGWVGLDSRLDLDVTARFSEESTRGMVAKNARLGGLTADDRLVIRFGLGGDLASPTFRLNTRAQVETVKEKAKERLRERVTDRLFKKLAPAQPEDTPETPPADQPPH